MAKCETQIKAHIRNRLGAPVIEVELDGANIDAAISSAKDWFCSHIGQLIQAELPFVSNETEYDVPEDCDDVVEVVFERKLTNVYLGYDFADVEIPPPGYPGSLGINGGYSDLLQSIQFRETARRILSSERDWEFDKSTKKIRFFPTNISSGRVIYWYQTDNIDIDKLQKYERWLIQEYALARSYEILGLIRSKYSEYPSASGSISLNGDALISRSETMILELEEKIKTLKRPLWPFTT